MEYNKIKWAVITSFIIVCILSIIAVSSTSKAYSAYTTITNTGDDVQDYVCDFGVANSFGVEGNTLYTNGYANANFSDLRFYSNTTTIPLAYWIKNYTTDTYAHVYVNIPFIPADGSVALTMTYGNHSLPPVSNGERTFKFFDDFSEPQNSILEDGISYVGFAGIQPSIKYDSNEGKYLMVYRANDGTIYSRWSGNGITWSAPLEVLGDWDEEDGNYPVYINLDLSGAYKLTYTGSSLDVWVAYDGDGPDQGGQLEFSVEGKAVDASDEGYSYIYDPCEIYVPAHGYYLFVGVNDNGPGTYYGNQIDLFVGDGDPGTYTRYGRVFNISDVPNDWRYDAIGNPHVIEYMAGKYIMWFSCTNHTSNYCTIGYAVTDSLVDWNFSQAKCNPCVFPFKMQMGNYLMEPEVLFEDGTYRIWMRSNITNHYIWYLEIPADSEGIPLVHKLKWYNNTYDDSGATFSDGKLILNSDDGIIPNQNHFLSNWSRPACFKNNSYCYFKFNQSLVGAGAVTISIENATDKIQLVSINNFSMVTYKNSVKGATVWSDEPITANQYYEHAIIRNGDQITFMLNGQIDIIKSGVQVPEGEQYILNIALNDTSSSLTSYFDYIYMDDQYETPPELGLWTWAPFVHINITPDNITQDDNLTVYLDASGSYNGIYYNWSWGDGTYTNGTDPTVNHTYAEFGEYEITLTLTNGTINDTVTVEVSLNDTRTVFDFLIPILVAVFWLLIIFLLLLKIIRILVGQMKQGLNK